MAELGGMYRAELSGVLGGLTRVRAIQLNDAHIFCAPDQVAAEAAAALGLINRAYLRFAHDLRVHFGKITNCRYGPAGLGSQR
jgi:threonyl-tRNA synthetase